MGTLYQAPFPKGAQWVRDTDFLAVDCEMTGLNPAKDSLLSMGWLEIKGGRVKPGMSKHMLIHSESSVERTAHIHGLHDHRVAGAASIAKVLHAFVLAARGKVLIFHHAGLDLAFLQKAANTAVGCPMLVPVLDTMEIERRRQALQNSMGSLQLARCRERYGLPPAQEHNALADARATAELFIAQCANMDHQGRIKLSDLGVRSV